MTAKRRLPWNFRTILYALLVILIVVAIIYVIFGPKEEAVRVYSIEEVSTNKQNLVNTVITIEGNYESQAISIVPPTTDDDPNPTNRIQLDLSNIPNATSDLRTSAALPESIDSRAAAKPASSESAFPAT